MNFISYSQNFEDVMLWRALQHVDRGFYIDVGANDPTIDSVTKAFYEAGWRGINIEPLISHHDDLLLDRPNDINLICAAGATLGEIELWECDVRGWATAKEEVIAQLSSLGHRGTLRRVPMRTLADICDEFVKNDIHFLKIDVEGFEQDVLEGADFLRFRPWIIVIESTAPNSTIEIHVQWEHLLLKTNYQLAYADGLNRFYVALEHSELLTSLRYPPNVFDNFTVFSHAKALTAAQQACERATFAEAQAQQACERATFAESQAQQACERVTFAESQAQQASARAISAEAQAQQFKQWLSFLLSLRVVRMLAKIKKWPELQSINNCLVTHALDRPLKYIAVDLTPVLPGGENGGAKIFVLELLRRLAEMAPQTQFVLLTQAASHGELDTLDRPNMRRLMVVGPVVANTLRPRLLGLATRLLPHFPARLRGVVNRLGYKLNTALKRGGSGALLRDMGVDLLFCPFTAPTYFEPGIPTVCTIYDLQYKTYPEFFAAEDVAHREHTFIEACRRAAALTAISDYSRDAAVTHGSLDPARIRTIHLRMAQRIAPGVEHDKAILDRLGLAPQRYLVYPANFWKHKNHEMLHTAFGIACHDGLAADIKLVCTGTPGARQAWLMNAARTMNLGDRILFPGYLPNAELAALMANCTGVVFPSLYEGFGLPVIEAMAAGVPVACSNTTSLPEVAAEAAILFDPRVPTQMAQAIISLVENDALRARLIQAGLQRAAEFSDTERMTREYWGLFQYALSNKKYENLLTGTFADGWVGPCMSIQVAPEASTQTLELELSAPEWLPQSPITIQMSLRGNPQGDPLVLQRGTSAVLSLALEAVGGYYEVVITPTFVPARLGHGVDQRELSVILQRCCILRADGEYINLFPEKVSA